jgi:hypothetical protein
MRLKLIKYYNYYDYPLDYLAEDDDGNKYICLIAKESNNSFIVTKLSDTYLEDLEKGVLDIRHIFEFPSDKLYIINITDQEYVDTNETTKEYVQKYLPDPGYLL